MSTQIKKGELIIISSDAYSDYSIKCICRATENFDLLDVLTRYLDLHPEQKEKYMFKDKDFIDELHKYVEDVEAYEVWLGEYATYNEGIEKEIVGKWGEE